jgi:hypothetical protein
LEGEAPRLHRNESVGNAAFEQPPQNMACEGRQVCKVPSVVFGTAPFRGKVLVKHHACTETNARATQRLNNHRKAWFEKDDQLARFQAVKQEMPFTCHL